MITAEDTLMVDDSGDKTSAWPAIALAAFAILVGIFCVKFGLQTLTWFEARSLGNSNSWILDVPQPLPAAPAPPPAVSTEPPAPVKAKGKSNAPAKIEPIKLYQFEFNPPWSGKSKIEPQLTYTIVRFESGQAVVFYDPDAQLDTIGKLKSSAPANYAKFAAVFNGVPVDSNFALYQQVYTAAPGAISPLMNMADAQREQTMLMWKLAFGPDLQTFGKFFSFDSGGLRGFQFGDPAAGRPVAVRVFDDKNRQFRFIFTKNGSVDAPTTQAEIDTAVMSLKPVPFLER